MSCSFYVYPESSVDIVWLVDYNTQPGLVMNRPGRSGRLPLEQRFTVLYDSRLHLHRRTSAGLKTDLTPRDKTHQQSHFNIETHLYGSRIVVREFRPYYNARDLDLVNSMKSLKADNTNNNVDTTSEQAVSFLLETQIVILASHVEDSGRYKCMAMNRAGNASLEFLLQIQPDPVARKKWYNSSSASQPEVDSKNQLTRYAANQVQSTPEDQRSNNKAVVQSVLPAAAPSSTFGGSWLRGATSFRLTIVIVSVLMGAVILAFILFCIIIYQIKPAPGPSTGATSTEPSTPRAVNCEGSIASDWLCNGSPMAYVFDLSPIPNQQHHDSQHQHPVGSNKMTLVANCDPLSGQSPVHLLGSTTVH